MKGWKEWGDENITDTSESVLKMFSFLRENVLRPHCPQHAFHCLKLPRGEGQISPRRFHTITISIDL